MSIKLRSIPIKKQNVLRINILILILLPAFIAGLVDIGNNVVGNTQTANAQGLPGVFGGNIGAIIPCTCTIGKAIFVGPPGAGTSNPLSPNWIHVVPSTIRYEYFQCRVGMWVLGNYRPPSPCLYFNGWHCVVIPVVGDAVLLGTSL